MRKTFVNEHGVECITSRTGTCFCHLYAKRRKDGKRVRVRLGSPDFETKYDIETLEEVVNDTVVVPTCCLDCRWYDHGEYGDYGTLLAGPYCTVGVVFPVRKGTCKRRQVVRAE